MTLITSGSDWTFEDLDKITDEIEVVARELGYSWYTNQIEIINAEQMLDAYASIGMPVMYKHWSFGKSFLRQKNDYMRQVSGLAYEIVINSDPCIVFCMENNSLLMQALVIAHAGIGHNHFFKNNELFKEWTQAKSIIPYLEYSKNFIEQCEEKYGYDAVEELLDIAHSLQGVNFFKYPRKEPLSLEKEMERKIHQALEDESMFNDLWRTVPKLTKVSAKEKQIKNRKLKYNLPEENIAFFLEKNSPILRPWQREIMRIVRNIAQYFYPQMQSQVMNEGCATYTHYTILNKLYDKGLVSDGAMLEFIKSHTSVVQQLDYDHKYYSQINPYALGFAMMCDIERICNKPEEEDYQWFPDIAGKGNHMEVLKYAWQNFRDESFIRQYLSPKVIRDFRFFSYVNDAMDTHVVVKNIHNEAGYRKIRSDLADHYSLNDQPQIEVVDVDLEGSRDLEIQYTSTKDRRLHYSDTALVVANISKLWGYNVNLTSRTEDGSYLSKISRKESFQYYDVDK